MSLYYCYCSDYAFCNFGESSLKLNIVDFVLIVSIMILMIFSLSCLCNFYCLKFLLLVLLLPIPVCCVPSSSSLGPTFSPRRYRTLSPLSSHCCMTSAPTPSNTWSRWGGSPRPPRTWPSHSCSRTSTTPRVRNVSCSRPSNTSWPISTCNSVCKFLGLKQSQPVAGLN